MEIIDIGNDFFYRLVNRNKLQGDGRYTAEDFREKYLSFLDNEQAWKERGNEITFDFAEVEILGPSFANEAFAYFSKYASKNEILSKIKFTNISKVKLSILYEEIDSGYSKK
jgi:hypothetical protein